MKPQDIVFFVILLFILIISVLLSGRMIFSGDFFYLADQARDYLLVQDIVENKNPTLIGTHSGLGGFFHGPLWLYQLIPFYLIGGGSPFVFTYAYMLIAVVTVSVGYVVGALLYNKKIGLIFALLLALSPSIWMYVPNTIGVNMVPLVFLLMFYFLVKHIRGEKYAYVFAVFFAGLSLQYETALPLILFPIVFLSFFLNKKAVKNSKVILLSIGAFGLSLATFILFDLKHNFLMSRSLITNFTSGEKEQGYLAFPERIMSHLNSFRGVYDSVLINRTVLLELLLALIVVIFLFVTIKKQLYKQQERKEILYLFFFPCAIFLFYLLYSYPVFPEYLLGLTVPVGLGTALILTSVWKNKIGVVVIMLFVCVTFFETGKILSEYVVPHKKDVTSGSYLNQKEVVDWVVSDSKGKAFGYFVYEPSTYTYGMDYLLWWETKSRGQEKPQSKKQSVTYLIMYPPLSGDEGAHAYWKKHKIRTSAKIVEKKVFASGIVVEQLEVSNNEPEADPSYHQNLIFR